MVMEVSVRRRRVLKGALGSAVLFAPGPWASVWAQSDGALSLLRLPKVALVLGNSRYKESPLKNPANDAAAIGAALRGLGFDATVKLDANRAETDAVVQAYVKTLATRQCVGLFYYAGHGVQLAWRNYMVPVDADIDGVGDIPKQCVEVNSLLEGLIKAANPLNVIILDACRDNPFGQLKGLDHKGLSQMDAPINTILAYATSPGNVASDGEGANGLYTENLLREMKVPEAKLEDVFKRVRLLVRRQSKGGQIPWESTSLEDDFWFIPPKAIAKIADDERNRAFEQHLKEWEEAKTSREVVKIEAFLRRYPSGEFSELAQQELDALLARQGEKRIEVPSQADNPFSQGFVRANLDFKVGDFYSYRVLDIQTKEVKRVLPGIITEVTDDKVIVGNGVFVFDRMGNTLRLNSGLRFTDNQNMPTEFLVGKRWLTRYKIFLPQMPPGVFNLAEVDYRIVRRERIRVPAGEFDCFRVEGRGQAVTRLGVASLSYVTWWAPEHVRRFIATEVVSVPPPTSKFPPDSDRTELLKFRQT